MTTDHLELFDSRSKDERLLALLEPLGLRPGVVLGACRLVDIQSMSRGIRIEFATDVQHFHVVLEARSPARRCFASTASFNIVHEHLPEGASGQIVPWLRFFANLLLERDPGGLDPHSADTHVSSVHVAHLESLFRLLPNGNIPEARSLCTQLLALVKDGQLAPDFIEPSFTLDRSRFRLGVNASARGHSPSARVPPAQNLLEMFGLPNAVDAIFLGEWLSDVERELFLGIEVANESVRQKVYLRTRSPDAASLLEAARSLGLACDDIASDTLQILSMDYNAGQLAGHKLYARISCADACALDGHKLLVPFLQERDLLTSSLTFYHSVRLARDEQLGAALYAEFPAPVSASVGLAYASRAGDEQRERFLEELVQRVPLRVSTLSETLGRGTPRHIYMTLLKQ